MSKIIFIPMEIKSRELDSRLLIALELVRKGCKVFLGEKSKINQMIGEYSESIYLAKSGAKIDASFFKTLKAKGHKIAVLDEEAIIHQNEAAHIKSRLNRESINMVDRFFSWGQYDNSVAVKAFPEEAEKFLVTGNPRIDLLRSDMREYYREPANELKQRYGKFIFIPSSFGMCNHFTEPGARLEWRKEMGMISSQEDADFYQAYVNHFELIFQSFLEEVPKLATKFSDYLFIVRPHPSENRKVWEDKFQGHSNIQVISDGPIAPWLLASEMVIHNGCTTAIESFLLDKNVISYRPYTSTEYDLDVPNQISMQAFDRVELQELMNSVLLNGPSEGYSVNGKKVLEHYLHSLDGRFAFEIIAEALNQIDAESKRIYSSKLLASKVKKIVRKLIGRKARSEYSLQKFPEIALDEINGLLKRYADTHFGEHNYDLRLKSENVILLQ